MLVIESVPKGASRLADEYFVLIMANLPVLKKGIEMKKLSAGVHTVIKAQETCANKKELSKWAKFMLEKYSFTKEAREYLKNPVW